MRKQQDRLQSAEYILLLAGFKEWLQLLNYSPLGIPGLGANLRNFLQYQEQTGKTELRQLEATDANNFIGYLQNATGERIKKNYSNNHINKHIQSLKLFSRYIRETGRNSTGFSLQLLEETRAVPVWLTQEEINALYEATGDNLLGIRDRAMLAVFYGCGLRLNEGACLEVRDIDRTRKVLHVRKGKGYKERFVPVAQKNFDAIRLYIDFARLELLHETKTNALFIAARKGAAMDRGALYYRVKLLVKKAGIKKKAGTHTLRHSIATHLLQNGMKLERIKEFLGHADLDSTQIYTHIINPQPPKGGKNQNSHGI